MYSVRWDIITSCRGIVFTFCPIPAKISFSACAWSLPGMSLNSSSGSVMPLDRGMAMAYTWLMPLRLSATALTVDWYFSASEPT